MYYYILLISLFIAGNIFAQSADAVDSNKITFVDAHAMHKKQLSTNLQNGDNKASVSKKNQINYTKSRKHKSPNNKKSRFFGYKNDHRVFREKNKFKEPYDHGLKNTPKTQYKKINKV